MYRQPCTTRGTSGETKSIPTDPHRRLGRRPRRQPWQGEQERLYRRQGAVVRHVSPPRPLPEPRGTSPPDTLSDPRPDRRRRNPTVGSDPCRNKPAQGPGVTTQEVLFGRWSPTRHKRGRDNTTSESTRRVPGTPTAAHTGRDIPHARGKSPTHRHPTHTPTLPLRQIPRPSCQKDWVQPTNYPVSKVLIGGEDVGGPLRKGGVRLRNLWSEAGPGKVCLRTSRPRKELDTRGGVSGSTSPRVDTTSDYRGARVDETEGRCRVWRGGNTPHPNHDHVDEGTTPNLPPNPRPLTSFHLRRIRSGPRGPHVSGVGELGVSGVGELRTLRREYSVFLTTHPARGPVVGPSCYRVPNGSTGRLAESYLVPFRLSTRVHGRCWVKDPP